MSPHSRKTEDLLRELAVDPAHGLTSEQAREKQKEYGENRLKEKKKKSNPQRFFDQFKDVMILILIIAAAISFAIAVYEKETKEFFEPALILLIVVMNAVIGVLQESKAEKALDALKKLTAPHARVIRDGTERMIDAALLVPGDIILLEAGDFIPADARLLRSVSLKAEESALTGESVPSEKDAAALAEEKAPLGDRLNMVFSGCGVTYGTASAVVTSTGMNTEMGKIADLLAGESKAQTPLQQKLATLGKYLGFAAVGACAVIFLYGIWSDLEIMPMFMTSVSLAVSAIPEGLPAIVTIILSIGVQRMVKKNAIIRRLPAVETLGSASVICSDKTGTLTQNRMTLVFAYLDGAEESEKISARNSDGVKKLLLYGALCSNGSVIVDGDGERHIGDPTETSIVLAAHKNGMPKDEINKRYPRKAEIPFDSDRKLMSTVNEIDGRNVLIVKGAFDILAERCVSGETEQAKRISDQMSANALRVIAVGYREIAEVSASPSPEEYEKDLILMGLVGMIDPPRPEAKDAVAVCRRAGIKPVMITGDHVITASAIAGELGILTDGDLAITGAQLDAMPEEELGLKIRDISVYARVSPENKIRIVRAWQSLGEVVSMTGDGVNDAPALKAADIGCAMGITGTDVAKGAADMILTDDNFVTIVDAVREGRGIYANIKKVVGFLLGTNIGEVLTVFFAMIVWHKTPLLSMQLLWINLVTDSMPAIALGMESVEPDIMDQKPKPKNEGIFAHGLGARVFLQGCMFALLTLTGFYVGLAGGTEQTGRTMAFLILSMTQIVQAYNMRSAHSLFQIGVFSNKNLNIACLISTLLVAAVLFTPLSAPFGLVSLTAREYGIGIGLALVPLPVMELFKRIGWIRHEGGKNKKQGKLSE